MTTALSVALATMAALAAFRDLIARTIPNGWCVAIAALGLVARGTTGTVPTSIAAAAAIFVLTAACWRAGWLGGGDVKLLSACALAVPPHLVPTLIFDTAIAGAVLGLIYLAARGRVRRPSTPRPSHLLRRAIRAEQWRLSRGGPLPYAVAIAAGVALVLAHGAAS